MSDCRDLVHRLAQLVATHTKHGPRGTGHAGPCDADCMKCIAERLLATYCASDDMERSG